jgi:hypothetical protein
MKPHNPIKKALAVKIFRGRYIRSKRDYRRKDKHSKKGDRE